MTLLELIIACSILLVLASAAMPVARFTVKRQKEAELHRDLREMRDAIDRYKDTADRNLIRVEVGTEGYPPNLDTLVRGVDLVAQPGAAQPGLLPGQPAGAAGTPGAAGISSLTVAGLGEDAIRHVRFLRRIPTDPMTGRADWGQRSVQDDPDSSSSNGGNVFDVFSLSIGAGLDGTPYSSW
jgi:general secretion pathway protein G